MNPINWLTGRAFLTGNGWWNSSVALVPPTWKTPDRTRWEHRVGRGQVALGVGASNTAIASPVVPGRATVVALSDKNQARALHTISVPLYVVVLDHPPVDAGPGAPRLADVMGHYGLANGVSDVRALLLAAVEAANRIVAEKVNLRFVTEPGKVPATMARGSGSGMVLNAFVGGYPPAAASPTGRASQSPTLGRVDGEVWVWSGGFDLRRQPGVPRTISGEDELLDWQTVVDRLRQPNVATPIGAEVFGRLIANLLVREAVQTATALDPALTSSLGDVMDTGLSLETRTGLHLNNIALFPAAYSYQLPAVSTWTPPGFAATTQVVLDRELPVPPANF
jgi:hypothetical protein